MIEIEFKEDKSFIALDCGRIGYYIFSMKPPTANLKSTINWVNSF